jgi:NAD(P)-dependent dehydrogenase (short-subunit alcohol dehydrogenase family)
MDSVSKLEARSRQEEDGLEAPSTLLITGSTIGIALAHCLAEESSAKEIWLTWRTKRPEVYSEKITCVQMDACVEEEVAAVLGRTKKLDGIINTIGLLHDESVSPEKSISRLNPASLEKTLAANLLPTLMLAKHARKALKDSERSWFASVSGRVGSIADNESGGWYSYRASKAALNMALKTLAIEWRFALPRCTVASLHPGTVKSPLSEPFTQRTAPERLFTPEQSAEHLKKVLLDLTPAESGRFWSWNGTEIPW